MTQPIEQTARSETSTAWAILPLGFATALSLMGDATLYSVLPTHYIDAGIALASVGLILSVNRFIRLITNGPAGWLFDRLPDRRALFLGSLAVGALSTVVYAISDGLAPLFTARLLWGLAWSGIWIGGNAIVLQIAPESQRGHWVGIYQVWFFLGSALCSFTGGALTDAVGYRSALWIGAGISALGALAATLALSARDTQNHHAITLPSASSWHVPFLPDLRNISPALWATAIANAMNRLAIAGIVVSTMGLIVQQSMGADMQFGSWQIGVASITGGLLAARTLVSLAGAPVAGTLSDRVGQRWGLLAISLIIGAIGIGIVPTTNIFALIVGTIASAIASGSIQSLTTALVGDLSTGSAHGKNLGLFYTAGDLGSAIGPLVAYAVLPFTGLAVVYLGCAILMMGTALVVMPFTRLRKST